MSNRMENGTSAQNDDPNGTSAQNDDLNGISAQNDDTNGTSAQNDDLNGISAQNDDPNGTSAQNDDLNGTSAQNDDPNGTSAQNDDLNGISANNDDPNGISANNDDPNGTSAQNDDLNDTSAQNDDPNAEKFRKLFIGGLNYDTTEENLQTYFEQWGEVVNCVVMKDPTTKRSRGFGFITYQNADQLDDAQLHRPHTIDNKKLNTKRSMPRDIFKENQVSVKRMFVRGLEETTSEDEIRDIFAKYGNIARVHMIKDKNTGKPKQFCFVTFDDFDSVDKCVIRKNFLLGSKTIEVKKAISRNDATGGRDGGRGGFGGYGGDWNRNTSNYSEDYGSFNAGGGGGWYPAAGGYGGDYDNNCYGSGFGSNYTGGPGGGPQRSGGFTQRGPGPYGGRGRAGGRGYKH